MDVVKFKAADRDKDGFLSFEELPSAIYPETDETVANQVVDFTMKHHDEDGDSMLTPSEFFQQEEGTKGEAYMSWDEQMEEFKAIDSDGDGKLNRKEVLAHERGTHHVERLWKDLFDMADTDKDKHLSLLELEKVFEDIVRTEVGSQLNEWVMHHQLTTEL